MSTRLLYLSQIRAAEPNLPFDLVEETSGQFNDVVLVNGEWVFRFPRYREGVAKLAAEAALLQALRGHLPLPIPDPVYQNLEPPVPGLAFMGYRMLAGAPFYRQAFEKIQGEALLDRLAGQLAEFLRMLHAMPLYALPVEAFGGDVQARDTRPEWEALYAEVREKLFPAMRAGARREVGEHFESYLDTPDLQKFLVCLRHGDFGGSNILWDRGQGIITGVIDFAYCAPGDPAVDLASVSTLGDDFFQRLAARYEPDESLRAPVLERARFYRGTFALMEALDGFKHGDQDAYTSGMQAYL